VDENAFDIHEFANTELRAFAAITGVLDPAKWHTGVGADIFVHEADTGFQMLGCDPFSSLQVARDDA
jgi:hypothetical protein